MLAKYCMQDALHLQPVWVATEAPLQCNGASVAYQRGPRCAWTGMPLHTNRGPVVCIQRPVTGMEGPDECLQPTTQQAVRGEKQAEEWLSTFYFSIFQKAFFYELFLQAARKIDSTCMVAITYGCQVGFVFLKTSIRLCKLFLHGYLFIKVDSETDVSRKIIVYLQSIIKYDAPIRIIEV